MRFISKFLTLIICIACACSAWGTNYAYDGYVAHNVTRDRIIAIAEDYATLYYYVGPANIDYSSYTGATCPDPTVGWKTAMKYCWGGEDTTKQYLLRMTQGDGAGNKDTSGSSSYDQYCAGADCSGFASNAWTSPRRATSSFPGISDDIDWEDLRQGDALNNAGSHIRVFDYFISSVGTAMLYESTAGGGAWRCLHRSLSRSDSYQPIRYNYTYDVYAHEQPVISYIVRTGIERAEVRWDGQADTGFRLYQSSDGSVWTIARDTITPSDRVCEISGLLPDHTYYFKMTSVNSGGETGDSDVVSYRLDSGDAHRVLLVDGYDRYNDQHGGSCHTLLVRFGESLGANGIGFDFCSNESVIDQQIDPRDYDSVIWMTGEDSTFDETFSWPEQMHLENFLNAGGSLFVSGSEIGWDLDYSANSTSWKNGSTNDRAFYNNYLLADYVADDAGTYHVQGAAIFAGQDFYFDDGTHGTYNVQTPDKIASYAGSTVGFQYVGGAGGNACTYGVSGSGKVVNFGFPFETIYDSSARTNVMNSILGYFAVPVEPPVLKSIVRTAAGTVTIQWEGHASGGFRLWKKTGGAWAQIKNEAELNSTSRSTTVSGLSNATRYAFKIQAVRSGGSVSGDSDVLACSLSPQQKVLVVDGYDRWNSQAGSNHAFVENFADALSANSVSYDSCVNEEIVRGAVALADYSVVMWMCGEESTESETLSYDEQILLQDYLKQGGMLFMSGSEIGWDLVAKADSANDYNNGSSNDTPFYNNYLKSNYVADDAGTYSVRGASGTDFEGLTFSFDNGTQGTYNVEYPDVISTRDGSVPVLYYGTGSDVAGIAYTGTFPGGGSEGKMVHFGFPFETVYAASNLEGLMSSVLSYLGVTETGQSVGHWQVY